MLLVYKMSKLIVIGTSMSTVYKKLLKIWYIYIHMYISMYVCIIILKLALQVISIIALWQLMYLGTPMYGYMLLAFRLLVNTRAIIIYSNIYRHTHIIYTHIYIYIWLEINKICIQVGMHIYVYRDKDINYIK